MNSNNTHLGFSRDINDKKKIFITSCLQWVQQHHPCPPLVSHGNVPTYTSWYLCEKILRDDELLQADTASNIRVEGYKSVLITLQDSQLSQHSWTQGENQIQFICPPPPVLKKQKVACLI